MPLRYDEANLLMPDIERDPDRAPPSGPWVDTNVMLEIYSHGRWW